MLIQLFIKATEKANMLRPELFISPVFLQPDSITALSFSSGYFHKDLPARFANANIVLHHENPEIDVPFFRRIVPDRTVGIYWLL
jgi:hypothetical protein